MKIYEKLKVWNEKRLRNGAIGFPFKIESATYCDNTINKECELSLSLKNYLGKGSCEYKLIGNKIKKSFMSDMGVSEIEELVGKKVICFIYRDGFTVDKLGINRINNLNFGFE